MKSLAVLFFGMLLWTQPAFASHADVTFFAGRGERFQLVLDGRLMNRYVTDQLHLPVVSPGYHVAEIRLPGRYGALVQRTRIFVEPGFRTDYLVQVAGLRPQIVVSKVREYPLPIVGRPVPAPYRTYPSGPGYYSNPYRDRDHYGKDRRDNGRYDNDRRNNDHRDNDHRDDRYDNDRRDNDRRDDRYDNDRRDSDNRDERYDNDRRDNDDRDDRGRDNNSFNGRDRGPYGRQLTSGS